MWKPLTTSTSASAPVLPLVAFSPDGHTRFATGNGPQVRLWRDTAGPEAP